jgi:hypothetical protein
VNALLSPPDIFFQYTRAGVHLNHHMLKIIAECPALLGNNPVVG